MRLDLDLSEKDVTIVERQKNKNENSIISVQCNGCIYVAHN